MRRSVNRPQSKECQKLSWKLTHKYTCVPIVVPPEEEETFKHYAKIIISWQNVWKWRLDELALMALDLANNPGKNITHWSVACLASEDQSSNAVFFFGSMWLEFVYTGQEDNLEKFKVSSSHPHSPFSRGPIFNRWEQLYRGCLRTAEEVLAESPRLQIMKDPPPLVGKRIRYATVFHFEEEGKPKQSFVRGRSWELPKSLEPWKDGPVGWDAVHEEIRTLFGGVGDSEDDEDSDEDCEEIFIVVPVDA